MIRELKDGEECILWDVFYSAVHDVAARHYSQAQVDAWAPENLDKTYWVERATNFPGGFHTVIQTNIAATAPTNSITDTNLPSGKIRFYRVGVEQ